MRCRGYLSLFVTVRRRKKEEGGKGTSSISRLGLGLLNPRHQPTNMSSDDEDLLLKRFRALKASSRERAEAAVASQPKKEVVKEGEEEEEEDPEVSSFPFPPSSFSALFPLQAKLTSPS